MYKTKQKRLFIATAIGLATLIGAGCSAKKDEKPSESAAPAATPTPDPKTVEINWFNNEIGISPIQGDKIVSKRFVFFNVKGEQGNSLSLRRDTARFYYHVARRCMSDTSCWDNNRAPESGEMQFRFDAEGKLTFVSVIAGKEYRARNILYRYDSASNSLIIGTITATDIGDGIMPAIVIRPLAAPEKFTTPNGTEMEGFRLEGTATQTSESGEVLKIGFQILDPLVVEFGKVPRGLGESVGYSNNDFGFRSKARILGGPNGIRLEE